MRGELEFRKVDKTTANLELLELCMSVWSDRTYMIYSSFLSVRPSSLETSLTLRRLLSLAAGRFFRIARSFFNEPLLFPTPVPLK